MKETIRKHIISWVEENIYSLANIDDLTKVLGYSRRTIETWFKQQYGQSLGDYILKRRICRAAVLIRMTSLPITEIAYLFHYQSSQGFARAFKKFTGLSPTDYRRSDVWEFDKLQPSLLLKDVQLPEVELSLIKFFNPEILGEEVIHRLKVYFYFSCLNAIGLIIWATYNRLRFRYERRKNAQRIQLPNLMASLDVDADTFMELQKAQRIVVTHNDHGQIQKVTRL